jgi:hypothetical protein
MTKREHRSGYAALATAGLLAGLTACGSVSSTTAQSVQTDTATVSATCAVFDMGTELPQFRINVDNATDTATTVNSLTVVGYTEGQEFGSTQVTIGQVITAGQSQEYWADLPNSWYADTTHPGAQPDTYTALPATCQILTDSRK